MTRRVDAIVTAEAAGSLAFDGGRSDDAGFISELCIALNHRWEPGVTFLLFTAYFDESDAHGPAPNLKMAAYLGSARQWELFGRKIRRLQRRDGFKVFHANEFKACAGEFIGRSHS